MCGKFKNKAKILNRAHNQQRISSNRRKNEAIMGLANCVEIAFKTKFKKVIASGNSGRYKCEFTGEGTVFIRHSDYPENILAFSADEWRAFIQGVKNGEFDLPPRSAK